MYKGYFYKLVLTIVEIKQTVSIFEGSNVGVNLKQGSAEQNEEVLSRSRNGLWDNFDN